jgi:hypothetical protein
MAAGVVYVLVNPALKGLLKIGKTTRTAEGRAAEISSGTGVPTKFLVAYEDFVEDCDLAERRIHNALSQYRYGKDREFFSLKLKDALPVIMTIVGEVNAEAKPPVLEQTELRHKSIVPAPVEAQDLSFVQLTAPTNSEAPATNNQDTDATEFFNEEQIQITTSHIVVRGAAYRLEDIQSFQITSEGRRSSGCGIFLAMAVGGFFALIAIAVFSEGSIGGGLIFLAFAILAFWAVFSSTTSFPRSNLVLCIANDEVSLPLEGDSNFIERLDYAIELSLNRVKVQAHRQKSKTI